MAPSIDLEHRDESDSEDEKHHTEIKTELFTGAYYIGKDSIEG